MATEKTFNTRIQLKYDTWDNWNTPAAKASVLKQGELATVYVPANTVDGQIMSAPAFLIKVGDGTTKFESLPWLQAEAADVYEWAKAATKPTYTASEISNLDSYISGNVATYKIEQDGDNSYKFMLQAKTPDATSWNTISTVTIPSTDAEVFYIDLEGSYPNYTCPVAMADIKAAYEAGKVLECRCTMGMFTATLPLFIPMPSANTWIFSGSGALAAMGFSAQSLTIAIVNGEVSAEGTALATKEVASSTHLGLVQPVAKTDAMTRSIGVDGNGGLYTEPSTWFVRIEQTSADSSTATANKTP